MALPLNVCQAQQGSSKTSSQEYTVYNLIGKENMALKDPLPTQPEQENNGRWRKNNTRASLSMGGSFSSMGGNNGIPFNLISTPCHGRRYRYHTKAFKPVFQDGAGIVMDTFWESGQGGAKTLVQVCCFVPFVGYPP
jgi:hypothetical protein